MATLAKEATSPTVRTYYGLSGTAWRNIALVLVVIAAVLLPFFVANYRTFQFTFVLVNALALVGINILTGFNGQFTLGHGAFFALGAYTAAIAMSQFGIPYWATLPLAGVICLVAGFLFGLPALRLEPLYLALATFALGIATPQLLKYRGIEQWTGGVQGIVISKPKAPFGLNLSPDQWLYLFSLAVLVVMFIAAWNLLRGRVGRAIVAIRDQPIAAQAMGINTAMYKSMTFGVSALYAGVAGALSAITVQFISPDSFVGLSIVFLVGSVIGGIFSIAGAIYGAIFLVFVPHLAEHISKAAPGVVFGIFLIVFMFVMPAGIAGFIRLVWAKAWRRSGASSARS